MVVAREGARIVAVRSRRVVAVGITVAHAAAIAVGSDRCSSVIVAVMVATTSRVTTRAAARVATRTGATTVVGSRSRRSVSARIPTVVVVIVIGVVMRIRGRKCARTRAMARYGRRHRRHETVVIVAVVAGPRVEARTRRQDRHNPSRIARAIP